MGRLCWGMKENVRLAREVTIGLSEVMLMFVMFPATGEKMPEVTLAIGL